MPRPDVLVPRAPSSATAPIAATRVDRRRVLDWADRLAARLEQHGAILFVACIGLYWAATLVFAARKLMWNDELYTYYVAALPSMRDVWQALLTGGEQTPPLFYLLTRLSLDVFGVSHISIRLPEMLGVCLLSCCLLLVIRRRTSWFPALCAALFPFVTPAYRYAFEARAYGLVLGFMALALLCWQAAADGRRRPVALPGLALSLAAAVSSHYYAVFAIVPLAAAEATRAWENRRLDVPVWAALLFPGAVLGLHLPLVRAGQAYSGAFWAPPQWVNIPDFYVEMLAPAIVPVALLLVAGLVHASLRDGAPPSPASSEPSAPPHELVAACGFILIPVICVVAAKLVTGAFADRYAIFAVIGAAAVAGLVVARAFRRSPFMRLTSVLALAGWFALSQAREYLEPTGFSLPISSVSIERPHVWLEDSPVDLPVIVSDAHTFTVLSHYGAPELRARIRYLADPTLALHHLGHNSVERGMLDLVGPWFDMKVERFEPFYESHPRFLVYGDFVRLGFLNWMYRELRERGAHLQLLDREGDNLLLLVSRAGGPPGSARAAGASAAPGVAGRP